jgi:hypothetical protein
MKIEVNKKENFLYFVEGKSSEKQDVMEEILAQVRRELFRGAKSILINHMSGGFALNSEEVSTRYQIGSAFDVNLDPYDKIPEDNRESA